MVVALGRQGLRIRCSKDVEEDVRGAVLDFAKWLRSNYSFPIRVVAYIKGTELLKNMSGEHVSATFFGPFDKDIEPYIRVAVGDYEEEKKKRGRDNALTSILTSLAHEMVHYQQWLHDKPYNEFRAKRRASFIVYAYSKTRDHP